MMNDPQLDVQVFIECKECEGTGLDLSYFDKMKHVVNRNEIPACEVCEGWGEIEGIKNV